MIRPPSRATDNVITLTQDHKQEPFKPPTPTSTHRHHKTQDADVRTQPLAYARRLPEHAERAVLVAVENRRDDAVDVRRRTDEQEDDKEEGLEIENRRLFGGGRETRMLAWEIFLRVVM